MQRHGLSWWAGGVLAAVVMGLGTAAMWSRPPVEGSAEVTFAREMSAHHAQAVDLSVTLLKRAADPAVKLLAQDILLTQRAQIGQLRGWLLAWGRPLAGRASPMAGIDRASMGLADARDERDLQRFPVYIAETRYLVLMRRHHQGDVTMARSALQTVRQPDVRAFAERVVAQTTELHAIDALLNKRMTDGQPRPEMEGPQHE